MPEIGERQRGHQLGYKSNDSYIWHGCSVCGKLRWVQIKKGEPSSLRCHRCNSRSKEGRERSREANWKGGRHIQAGYFVVHLTPDDFFFPMCFSSKPYVFEHRLAMAKHLGRCLHSWETVHHKNGDKLDNRLENLELIDTLGEHIREHSRGYKVGFSKGYNDGRDKKIKELQKIIEKYGQEIELL